MNPDDSAQYLRTAVDSSLSIVHKRAEASQHEQSRAQAQAAADRLWAERAAAIWHLYHDAGETAPRIAQQLEQALRGRGLTEDQISRLGISHDAVRRIVGSRRNPKPQPR